MTTFDRAIGQVKRPLLAIALCLAFSPWAHAQKFFLEAHGTFQFPLNDSFEQPDAQGGAGVVFGGEFARAWCWEGRFTYKNTVEANNTILSGHTEFAPAIRFRSFHGAFTWHASAGPTLLLIPDAHAKVDSLWRAGPDSREFHGTLKYEGGLGLGGFAAFGFTFQDPMNPRIAYLAEINARSAAWAPAQSTTSGTLEIKYNSALVSATDSTVVTEYGPGSNGPSFPMSTWGIRVGFQIRIGKLEEQSAPPQR